eukprot:TRINITY_DN20521_c0_g1_i1.p1 TRINITY_DN20521_c0_g1~~TRINITY_DN20521_c0_g1_i1.p1  ORF type:complete len:851 (+),score=194.02 TRINITY_DN20521_c0_g1_i1:171-2723(+)
MEPSSLSAAAPAFAARWAASSGQQRIAARPSQPLRGRLECRSRGGSLTCSTAPPHRTQRPQPSLGVAAAVTAFLAAAGPSWRRRPQAARWRLVLRALVQGLDEKGEATPAASEATAPQEPRSENPIFDKYDPPTLWEHYSAQPLLVVERFLKISFALFSFAFAVYADSLSQDGAAAEDGGAGLGRRLRELCTDLGPTFVKIGQMLSVSVDLLSGPMREELSKLQDGVKPFDHNLAMQLIKQELQLESLNDYFACIGREPVAAASLGQVYKGKLRDGRVVAIKVQRPGIPAVIALDLLLARKVAELLVWGKDWLPLPQGLRQNDFVGYVDAFGTRVFEELDYVKEAGNIERFQALYGDQPRLKVPDVYSTITTRRVLVMEWVDGLKLTDVAGMRERGQNPLDAIDIGIECSMRQLLEGGFFHADPHPGNFLVTPKGELCVLDFGLMSEMPKDARLSIIRHIVHLVNRDYKNMAKDYYYMGFLSKDVDIAPLPDQLSAYFEPRLRPPASSISFKTIVDGLSEVIFKNYVFSVPTFYALVVRSLVTLEGMALSIDRKYRVLAAAYPYMARRILLDAELRESLVELLFDEQQLDNDRRAAAASEKTKEEEAAESEAAARVRWDRVANLMRESAKSNAKVPTATATGKPASEGALYVDLASSLTADPVFQTTLMNEFADTVDLFIADAVSNAAGQLLQPGGGSASASSEGEAAAPTPAGGENPVSRALRLQKEDEVRLSAVRETMSLLGDKLSSTMPKDAGQLAETAARAAGSAVQAAQDMIASGRAPEAQKLANDLVGQLGERFRERSMKVLGKLLNPSGESAPAKKREGGGQKRGTSRPRPSAEEVQKEAGES